MSENTDDLTQKQDPRNASLDTALRTRDHRAADLAAATARLGQVLCDQHNARVRRNGADNPTLADYLAVCEANVAVHQAQAEQRAADNAMWDAENAALDISEELEYARRFGGDEAGP
ncbi:hypothetical protein H7X46_00015 [Pseudonocardia sp. C8]|uniref:hypothetical protein n=1 Tax=Pseudonocardia sp. C8 TaxID=2762759 RepID=UPI0016429E2B|nr:hypothetical protein [Pseudonocardia sp. C8]MBC3189456.1 hypothetical protein [Pseudonocardia sp. C8]